MNLKYIDSSIFSFLVIHNITLTNAMRGEITMAKELSFVTAGSWKHNDFPDPVGIQIYTSLSPGN